MTALDSSQIARIETTSNGGPILVALSGGGDSTALLYLLLEAFGAARLRVCIVDHALRQGSAADAALACERAGALGVAAQVETLSWPNGPKSNQAAFRAARYRALCAVAREISAQVIAVGHNADDQAETVHMRAESGSSWRGLAGMRAIAPAPVWPEGRGIFLSRPLLNLRRAELREFLIQKSATWIEDPANANPDFARVRMRARLAKMEESEGFDPLRLCKDAEELQSRAAVIDAAARELALKADGLDHGFAELHRSCWHEAPDEVRRRALSVLIAAIAGAEREPAPDALEKLEQTMFSADFTGATLGGAAIRLRNDAVSIGRDSGAVLGRADGARPLPMLLLPEDRSVVWDGRLELIAARAGWQVVPDSRGRPILKHGRAVQTLAEAKALGEVRFEWLARAHIAQLLPPREVAFTPS